MGTQEKNEPGGEFTVVFLLWGLGSDHTEPRACLVEEKNLLYILLPYTVDVNTGALASCYRVIKDIKNTNDDIQPLIAIQKKVIETVLNKFKPTMILFHGCSHGAILLYRVLKYFTHLKNIEFHAMGSPLLFPKDSLGFIKIKHIYYNDDYILKKFLVKKVIDKNVVSLLKTLVYPNNVDVDVDIVVETQCIDDQVKELFVKNGNDPKKYEHVTMRPGNEHCYEPDLYDESYSCMSEFKYKQIVEGYVTNPVISGFIQENHAMSSFYAVSNSILRSKTLIDMSKSQIRSIRKRLSQLPDQKNTVTSLFNVLINLSQHKTLSPTTYPLLKHLIATRYSKYQRIEFTVDTFKSFGITVPPIPTLTKFPKLPKLPEFWTHPYHFFQKYIHEMGADEQCKHVTYRDYTKNSFEPTRDLYVVTVSFPYTLTNELPKPKEGFVCDHAVIAVAKDIVSVPHFIAATFDKKGEPIVIDSKHLQHGEIPFNWPENSAKDAEVLLRTLNIFNQQKIQFRKLGFAYILYRRINKEGQNGGKMHRIEKCNDGYYRKVFKKTGKGNTLYIKYKGVDRKYSLYA